MFALLRSPTILITTSFTILLFTHAAADPHVQVGWSHGYDSASPLELLLDGNEHLYIAGANWKDCVTLKYDTSGGLLWVQTYDGPESGEDGAADMVMDAAGNIYITGVSNLHWGFNGYLGGDVLTLKYGPDGALLWARQYAGSDSLLDRGNAIAVDANGGVYVAGSSDRDCGWYPCFGGRYTVLKYDSDGDLEWVRQKGLGSAAALGVDSLGYVYVTGYESDSTGNDVVTRKYDSSGNQLWERRYDGPSHGSDRAVSIHADALGNAYVAGASQGDTTVYDYLLLKYDPDGNLLWDRRYDGPANGHDWPAALNVDAAGCAYVTGKSTGSGTMNDFATLKYDSSGNLNWAQRYDGFASLNDEAADLTVDGEGSAYVTGRSLHTAFSYAWDYLTLKYDSAGALLWATRYNSPDNGLDLPVGIRADAAGNAYVTGRSDYAMVTLKYVPCTVATGGDSDGDSVANPCDNCPDEPNPNQADADVDGVGDTCDNCPHVFGLDQTDTDGDGMGDVCDPILVDMTGDMNNDGTIASEDIILMVNYLFKGGTFPQPCEAAGDVNCSGENTPADVVYLANYVFRAQFITCDVDTLIPVVWSCP